MKNLSLVFLISFLFPVYTIGQPCLEEGITFTTQAAINSFHMDYPDCHEIGGNVSISGSTITSLTGLASLTKIDGDLSIYSNTSLTSLEGLNNLTSIRGALNISGNSILTDLTGLSRLISVGGTVTIIYHDDLVDFSGLNVLRSIGGDLQIVVNPGLTSLDGLEKLDSIGGTLFIYGNSTLTGISGLQSLTTLRGTLAIQYNPLLLSLSGLENIAPASLGGLAVTNNDVLSTCNVTGICNYLAYPGASVTIVQNGEGCNSQTEVEAACKALSSGDLPTQTIDIYPNPCRESFTIRTDVILSENDITIYNNLGQRTGNWRLQNSTVDISQLRQGAYLLILQNKRDPIRAKIIVY